MTDDFISSHTIESNMGNSNTGNQRFVNACYRYIKINGPCSLHEIVSYVDNNLSPTSQADIGQASALIAVHPMFRSIGQTKHRGNTNTYSVSLLDIVPEDVVVAKLALATHEGKSLIFAFRKYPAFIRKQVSALLDSPDFNPDELKERIEQYKEMLLEEQ